MSQRNWKQGDTVLLPFAVSDNELPADEVDVLGSQTRTLEEPQSRSVKERRHELRDSAHLIEDGVDFDLAQDNGYVPGASRANQVLDPRRRRSQDSRIEKHERTERLMVGRCTGPAPIREVVQKAFDVRCTQVSRMAPSVKIDEAPHPSEICPLGSVAVVASPELDSRAFKQPRTDPWSRGSSVGH